MNALKKMDSDSVIEALKRAGANTPCPRCGNPKFTLLEGYDNILINRSIGTGPFLGSHQVPTVLLVCEKCGYLSTHALGALGLLPPEEDAR